MSALRDFAEVTISNEPGEPAGATLVERLTYADEKPVFPTVQPVGQRLEAARRGKGLTLLDVAKGVKIKIEHLVAIEAGDRDALPAVPFTAGFIKAYAQFLGLDPEEYATAYRREVGAPSAQPEAPAPVLQWESPTAPKREHRREFVLPMGPGALASYFGISAAVFCVFWFGMSMLPRTAPELPARAEQVAEEKAVEEALTVTSDVAAAGRAVVGETTAVESATETTPGAGDAKTPSGAALFAIATPKVAPRATHEVVAELQNAPAETFVTSGEPAAPPVTPITLPKGPKLAWAQAEMKKEAAAKKAQEKREKAELAKAEAAAKAEAEKARALAEAEAAANAVMDLRADVAAMNAAPQAMAAGAPAVTAAPVAATPAETTPAVAMAAAAVAPAAAEPKIVPARILRAASPVYPERCARNAAATESINVIFSITVEGRPAGAAVVDSSNPCFNSAAVDAASDMRFAPRLVDGKAAIETAKVVTVRFTR